MKEGRIVAVINYLYIAWSIITIFSVGGLRVPFTIVEPDLTNIPVYLGSLAHLCLLALIGGIIPKRNRLGVISSTLSFVVGVFAFGAGLNALSVGETLFAVIGICCLIFPTAKNVVDYYRGAFE